MALHRSRRHRAVWRQTRRRVDTGASTGRKGSRGRSSIADPQVDELRVVLERGDFIGAQREVCTEVGLYGGALELLAVAKDDRAEGRRISPQVEVLHIDDARHV